MQRWSLDTLEYVPEASNDFRFVHHGRTPGESSPSIIATVIRAAGEGESSPALVATVFRGRFESFDEVEEDLDFQLDGLSEDTTPKLPSDMRL